MVQRTDSPVRGCSGFTLVELVVALSITAIVITLVMFSWTFLLRHTTKQEQKAAFGAQIDLAASLIANDIQRASEVISFDNNSIAFVPVNGDTVLYRLRNDTLVKNDTAFSPLANGVTVLRFSVAEEKQPSVVQAGIRNTVLTITLGARDRTGIETEIRSRVMVRLSGDSLGPAGSRAWNY